MRIALFTIRVPTHEASRRSTLDRLDCICIVWIRLLTANIRVQQYGSVINSNIPQEGPELTELPLEFEDPPSVCFLNVKSKA